MTGLHHAGFTQVATGVSEETLAGLRNTIFVEGRAGKRCLLGHPLVADTTALIREVLLNQGFLAPTAVAIQAIAFDKSPAANWKVPWHQDLMFPFARPVESPGFLLPTLKDGVHFAQPPLAVLEEILAVRLHLDDCDSSNGPLRVSPGTHRLGILPSASTADHVRIHGQVEALAKTGEAILMRPLLLHASSQAVSPNHRRVLHLVFHSGTPIQEPWAQTI